MEDKIPLRYRDRREEGETTLRQCQLVQLHLLHVFDRICKENGLQYLLEGGTLLGAMRHNGFIPWDDDLDVGMPRKDYEKFLKIAPTILPEDVRLQTPADTPRTAIPFAKLRDVSSYFGESRPDMSTADPSGIYIDVFPYDDMPKLGRKVEDFVSRACSCSWMRMKYFYNKCGTGALSSVFFAFIGGFFHLVHDLVRFGVWLLNCILPSENYYLCLEHIDVFPYPRRQMFPAKSHAFEDAEFPVPANADAILTSQYGDWRQIPPPEKRPRHARIIDPFSSADGRNSIDFVVVMNQEKC